MNNNTVYYVWYTTKWSQCSPKMAEMLMHFGDIVKLYDATYNDYSAFSILTANEIKKLCDKDLKEAEKIIENCLLNNIDIMTIDDDIFPQKLRQIYNPPIVLYYKGKLPNFDEHIVITIVGSREPVWSAQELTNKIAHDLAKSNFLIVSGLAIGIDGFAHRGALEVNGITTGFLAGGLDNIYPSQHRDLADFVMSSGGLISEYPPSMSSIAANYSFRNRLMSGVSDGVLIVAAREKSGTLLTANHALEQNKDIFVVPGDVFYSSGSNKLLKLGAKPVTEALDIIEEYITSYPQKIKEVKPDEKKAKKIGQIKPYIQVIKNQSSPESNVIKKESLDLTENEKTVLKCIKENEPINIDNIYIKTKLPIGTIMSSSLMLEMYGYVTKDYYENYSII